ncbi:MAG: RidA family protein [Dehalococcoidia bacterium]
MHGTPANAEGIFSYKDNLKISHAVKSGNTIHISGQIAVDPQGRVVGEGDIGVQAEYIWGNIRKVLEAAGSSLEDVVKIFQFVVGAENFPKIGEARQKAFPKEPYPCSTGVIIDALVYPGLLLEVDVIAVTS